MTEHRMHIAFVEIQNFRKLKTCRVEIAQQETIFVGANNSGKTEAFARKAGGVRQASPDPRQPRQRELDGDGGAGAKQSRRSYRLMESITVLIP